MDKKSLNSTIFFRENNSQHS